MAGALDIERMTLEEKLRAMEALWEALCRNANDVPIPEWHKTTLDERERAVADGKARFSDWESAKRRINDQTS